MPAEVSASWKQYLSWLSENVPNARDALAPPASEADLAKLEQALGAPLPASVREFWSLCGGQIEMDGPSLAGGFVFLSPADALREWQNWAELRTSEGASGLEKLSMNCTSSPANAIQAEYTVAGWLPLWKERLEGNYLGVDLAPGPDGSLGQVIHFGRDEDEKSVLFWDFSHLLSWLADEAKSGNLAVEEDDDDEDIQHVVHQRGRVVGVLQKLAGAGDIPTGRKPKAAPAAVKPAAKKASASKKEILPEPPKPLPPSAQAVLERILARLRQCLPDDKSKAGYWQFTLSDPKNPKGSYGGNVLTLEERTVPYGTSDIDGIDQEYLRLCQASMDAGLPLKKVDVGYAHDGNDWRLEVGIETGANYDKVEKARRPLDLKLTSMLHDYGNQYAPNWDTVSFTFRNGAFELFVMVVPQGGETTRETLVAPEEFQVVFADVRALYERFGRIVRIAVWRADPKKVGKPNVMVNSG